jgi:hypothetical protein
LIVIAVVVVLAAVGAAVLLRPTSAGESPHPAALDRARESADALPRDPTRLAKLGFDPASSRRVASHLYLVRRAGGQLCQMVVHDNGGGGGGCGPAGEFFHGNEIVVGTGWDGRPSNPTSVWVAGVGRRNVAAVRIHFGAVTREVALTTDDGFYYEATAEDLAAGFPTTIDAVGANGRVLATYPLPQG